MKHRSQPLKELLFAFHRQDFASFLQFWRSQWMGWLLFVALVVSCGAILTVVWWPLPSNILVGDVVTHDIIADQEYAIIDQAATEELRKQALSKILPIFNYAQDADQAVVRDIEAAFTQIRTQYETLGEVALAKAEEISPAEIEDLRTLFTDQLGVSLSVRDFEALRVQNFDPVLVALLTKVLREAHSEPIVAAMESLEPYFEKGILVQEVEGGKAISSKPMESAGLKALRDVSAVREDLMLAPQGTDKVFDEKVLEALTLLAHDLIRPTLLYDETASKKVQAKALGAVEGVMIRVKEGESVVRRGNRYTERDISIIEGIKKAKVKRNFRLKFFGTTLFLFFFLLVLYAFASRFLYRFHPGRKDLVFLGCSLILVAGLYRIGFSIAHAVSQTVHFEIPFAALHYVIPVAGGAIMIRMVRNAAESLIFAVAIAISIGFAPDAEFHYAILYLAGGLVGAGAAAQVRSRLDLLRAGFFAGLVQAVLIISFELIHSTEVATTVSREGFFWNVGLGLFGGLSTASVAILFTPLAESVFGYLSDIKLLELGSLNHPLLRELIVRAPGTYHHSHLVGTLAEAACQAIGANGLFARVASYFHDIGKMKKAPYFIENQKGEPSRHDNLTPSMSALIIMNHVKDGMEMAKRYKLPQPIVDVIPQHQGTKLVSYFYSRAKEQENPEMATVKEGDYRYPGPRPQSREAGVVMLSDGVEAATRALADKSPTKIRGVVESMVNKTFTDGQLDECGLTLRDLHVIADTFTNLLTGIYHQRIEYPELPESGRDGEKDQYGDRDKYLKSEPIKDSATKETHRPTLKPVRDLKHTP